MTPDETRSVLARNLRAVRLIRGLSQTEVGEYLGVRQATVSEIERNRRDVKVPELVTLSEIFEVSIARLLDPDWMLGGTG